MSFQINTDQQRIEASGTKATGNWTNATYSRTAAGVGNIVSVAHGEALYWVFLAQDLLHGCLSSVERARREDHICCL